MGASTNVRLRIPFMMGAHSSLSSSFKQVLEFTSGHMLSGRVVVATKRACLVRQLLFTEDSIAESGFLYGLGCCRGSASDVVRWGAEKATDGDDPSSVSVHFVGLWGVFFFQVLNTRNRMLSIVKYFTCRTVVTTH